MVMQVLIVVMMMVLVMMTTMVVMTMMVVVIMMVMMATMARIVQRQCGSELRNCVYSAGNSRGDLFAST